MFTVRTIHADAPRLDVATYDLTPESEAAQAVCNLFRDYLVDRPTEFRDKLPFIKKGDWELQWAAAADGVAFASFIESGEPVSMGVFLTGLNADADQAILGALGDSIITPILGDSAPAYLGAPERPVLVQLLLPGRPELEATVELLAASLASVFFRVIAQLRAGAAATSSSPEADAS